nr:electron transport complex subunit E [Lachnospiraceae bacterium]
GQAGYTPISIFILAPGAFFVLSVLVAVMNVVRKNAEAKGKPLPAAQGCLGEGCSGCGFASMCSGKSVEEIQAVEPEKKNEE